MRYLLCCGCSKCSNALLMTNFHALKLTMKSVKYTYVCTYIPGKLLSTYIYAIEYAVTRLKVPVCTVYIRTCTVWA